MTTSMTTARLTLNINALIFFTSVHEDVLHVIKQSLMHQILKQSLFTSKNLFLRLMVRPPAEINMKIVHFDSFYMTSEPHQSLFKTHQWGSAVTEERGGGCRLDKQGTYPLLLEHNSHSAPLTANTK